MSIMRLFLALLFFVFMAPAFPHGEASNTDKDAVVHEQRGTETKPMFIQGTITTQKSVEEAGRDTAENNKRAAIDNALIKYSGLSTLFAFLLLVAVATQVALFSWQLRLIKLAGEDGATAAKAATKAAIAAEKTLKTMQDTSKKQSRAYLGVTDFGLSVMPGAGGTHALQVFVQVGNSGQTPAHKATLNMSAEMMDADAAMAFPNQSGDSGSHPVAPGAQMIISRDLHDITAAQMMELKAGNKNILVWGKAAYIDIFGDAQLLEFRFKAVAETRNQFGIKDDLAGWRLQPEQEGNNSS